MTLQPVSHPRTTALPIAQSQIQSIIRQQVSCYQQNNTRIISPLRQNGPPRHQFHQASSSQPNTSPNEPDPQTPVTPPATTPASPPSTPSSSHIQQLTSFLTSYQLPLGLVTAMTIGALYPAPGNYYAKTSLQQYSTMGIFFISGLNLRLAEISQVMSTPISLFLGMLSIMLLTTGAAPLLLRLPFSATELAVGMAVFACMPTTLSSGVQLVQAVGGNVTLALLLTVATNLLATVTMPVLLCTYICTTADITIRAAPLIINLIKVVLLPLLFGVTLKELIPILASWVRGNKQYLGMASTLMLCTVPWMQISKAVSAGVMVALPDVALVTLVGVALHSLYLAGNAVLVRLFIQQDDSNKAVDKQDVLGIQRALILVCSQKTLPVAVSVLSQISVQTGLAAGIAVIPCIASHLTQILIDSYLVSWWNTKDKNKLAGATV